jgi:hypothetical protein
MGMERKQEEHYRAQKAAGALLENRKMDHWLSLFNRQISFKKAGALKCLHRTISAYFFIVQMFSYFRACPKTFYITCRKKVAHLFGVKKLNVKALICSVTN